MHIINTFLVAIAVVGGALAQIPSGSRSGESARWEDISKTLRSLYENGRELERAGNGREALRTFGQAYDQGAQAATTLKTNQRTTESFVAAFADVSSRYAWHLLHVGNKPGAEAVVRSLENVVDRYDPAQLPSGLLFSYGTYETGKSFYASEYGSEADEQTHSTRAVDLLSRAAAQADASIDAMSSAIIMLQAPFLRSSGQKRQELLTQICSLSQRMTSKYPGDPRSALGRFYCLRMQSLDQAKQGKVNLARETLDDAEHLLYGLERAKNTDAGLCLVIAELEQAGLSSSDRKDQGTRNDHLIAAKEYFVEAMAGHTLLETSSDFRYLYQGLTGAAFAGPDKAEAFYKDIVGSISASLQAFPHSRSITLIAADSYGRLAQLYLHNAARASDASGWLAKSISMYLQSDFLSSPRFSETTAEFCQAQESEIELSRATGRLDGVRAGIKNLLATCTPALERYPWDFYLRLHLIAANEAAGKAFFDAKRYSEAMPYLQYASRWGFADSSHLLKQIYEQGLGVPSNVSLAQEFENLAGAQSVEQVTMQVSFNGIHAPFVFYLYEWPKDYQFSGVDDQVAWLREARGGQVPADAAESFRKVQKIARDNHVSFPRLWAQAMNKSASNRPR